jgi:hypothetical protein
MVTENIVFFHPTSCNQDQYISNIYLYFHFEALFALPFQKMKFAYSTWKSSYSRLPYGNLQSDFIHDDCYGLFLMGYEFALLLDLFQGELETY